MALQKSCVTRYLTTKEKAHFYELRWTIKNAMNRLLAGETLLSGSQEVSDPEDDRYNLTISMELSPDPTQDGQLKLFAKIPQFHLKPKFATRALLTSYIDKVAMRALEHDTFYVITKLTTFSCNSFRRDDLLDESKCLIVNDTLTIVLALVIDVYEEWRISLTDPAEQPTKSAFAKLFNSEFLSDVVLRSSEGRQFRAHKVILAAHSPVFRAMFESGLKETTESEVEIDDCSAEVVEQMLSFIYTGATPKVGDDNLFDLLKVADKYDIKDLLAVCENKIAQSTDSNNAAEVLMLADTFGAKKLKKSAMDWIARHISDAMGSPSWKTLSKPLVEEILQKVADRLNTELL